MNQFKTKSKPRLGAKAGLLALLVCNVQTSPAAQAPWYWWQSTLTGKQICRQNSPGEGWQQLAQPYLDARCQRPKS